MKNLSTAVKGIMNAGNVASLVCVPLPFVG